MPECDGLSWLETNILVTKFGPPKQKILAPPLAWLSTVCGIISLINLLLVPRRKKKEKRKKKEGNLVFHKKIPPKGVKKLKSLQRGPLRAFFFPLIVRNTITSNVFHSLNPCPKIPSTLCQGRYQIAIRSVVLNILLLNQEGTSIKLEKELGSAFSCNH